MVVVGVLALQGDFLEHLEILRELGVETRIVKKPEDLSTVNGLVIPGGESTTIGTLMAVKDLGDHLVKHLEKGLPVMGTCAGAILLANKVADRVVGETNQYTLKVMNISIVRNIFGRQRNSFIADVEVENVGVVRAAFIRAPGIVEAWTPAKITGYVEHPTVGRVGAVAEQDSILALTFHPEITGDKKIYQYFVTKIKR
ncbi:MAG: pyridoxal 5'-phosphate synthase glutaminase subunit PdxT [Desulfurococcus sp.]|uniref:pyridoxal 5'-phosphate synthase glutaminase subunit PdxT n=1 Tax=Thermoprotei TaxID=183924 RepID=UPI003163C3B3